MLQKIQAFYKANQVWIAGLIGAVIMSLQQCLANGPIDFKVIGLSILMAASTWAGRNLRGKGVSVAGVVGVLLITFSSINVNGHLDWNMFILALLTNLGSLIAPPAKNESYEQSPEIMGAKLGTYAHEPLSEIKDFHSIPILQALHPKAIPTFRAFIIEIEAVFGLTFRIVQGGRSFEYQQGLYDQGRTKPGIIVTWAEPGHSWHNFFLAIDICPFKSNMIELDWNFDFKKLASVAAKHGIQCGINFPKGKTDADHFELTFGHTIAEVLEKYNAKDFIPGTNFVNI